MDLELPSRFYHKIIALYKINSIYGAILKLERAQSFEFIIVLFFTIHNHIDQKLRSNGPKRVLQSGRVLFSSKLYIFLIILWKLILEDFETMIFI